MVGGFENTPLKNEIPIESDPFFRGYFSFRECIPI